jgi:fluoroacetyl-CoA thioesterase
MSLQPGLQHELRYRVGSDKTVPCLYPESAEFRAMPAVFATGFLVGLLEWACIDLLHPLLAEGEQSLGTHIDVSHLAPNLPGDEIVVRVTLREVDGRRLVFDVEARDARGVVGAGRHERHVIERARFDARMARRGAPG